MPPRPVFGVVPSYPGPERRHPRVSRPARALVRIWYGRSHLGLLVDDLGDLRRWLRARVHAARARRQGHDGGDEGPCDPADDELDAWYAATDCAGARQITAGHHARTLADALIAGGVARALDDGVPWRVIALDLGLRVGAARRRYDPALGTQEPARGSVQRRVTLSDGQTVPVGGPAAVVYTDAELRALARSLGGVLGGPLSWHRHLDPAGLTKRRRRTLRAAARDRAEARRFETDPPDPELVQLLVGPHRIAAALRRHDAALAQSRTEMAVPPAVAAAVSRGPGPRVVFRRRPAGHE